MEELLDVPAAQRVEDPFTAVFAGMAYQDLQPHQAEAIRRAEEALALVPA
jgi:hypothetical protein